VQRDHAFIDLHATDRQLPQTVRQILTGGADVRKAVEEAVRRGPVIQYKTGTVKLLPPVPDPPKIVCLGLNYRDHAAESGAPIPKDPVLFSKYNTALIGPDAPIVLPPVSKEVDYEAELVVVVGKRGRPRDELEALAYVA